jgi:hypothetical protein
MTDNKTTVPTTSPALNALIAVTHVSVPIATLQALHAQLTAHADAIAALIPAADPASAEAALAAATEARLKAQRAAGK